MKFGKNRPEIAVLPALILVFLLISGCIVYDDEHGHDDGEIRICNYDNHEYRVELRDYYNNRIEDEFWVEDRYDFGDQCDEFDHVDNGMYYLAIYRGNDSEPWDVSGNFYMDDDEFEYFWIDEDGDLHRD